MKDHLYPEEAITAAQLRAAHAVTIGADVRRCPNCGNPLSYVGAGNRYPLCRHCHQKHQGRRPAVHAEV